MSGADQPVTFAAMGTTWWVQCDRVGLAGHAPPLVAQLEAALSRFRTDSTLSRLNREREVTDALLAEVVQLALTLREQTAGAFDPTLGRELATWGYDRDFATLPAASGVPARHLAPLAVEVVGSRVTLDGPGALDLGGIAKGWAADRVAEALRAAGGAWVVVDAGGDLRVSGRPTPLAAADGSVVMIDEGGLATSSTLRRRWTCTDGTTAHHLLDPVDAARAGGSVHTATVRAPTAAQADAWAKALVVRPALTPVLRALGGHAWLGDTAGRWWTTTKEAA